MPWILPRVVLLSAAAAMLVTATSATAQDVKINIGLGVPPLVLTAPPQLVMVPGTPVNYAPDVSANLFFGSCVTSVRCEGTSTHPLNQRGGDPFGIDHGFIRCDIMMQVLLMHSAEGT
jgi:hypothetical protein